MSKLVDIEGIGPAYSEKLSAAGVKNVADLLVKGKTPKDRKALAEASGIDGKRLLRWINMADLFRIHGVGEEFSDLLEASGVDTVKELAQRNAVNLHQKMAEVNEEKKLCRRTPSEKEVTKWIEEAKELPRMIEY